MKLCAAIRFGLMLSLSEAQAISLLVIMRTSLAFGEVILPTFGIANRVAPIPVISRRAECSRSA